MSYAKSNSANVCEIRVVEQLGGKDPDEFIREFGADKYKEQIKTAPLLLDYELNQITKQYSKNISPQEKSILVQQIADILKEIQNPVILSDYVRDSAYKINVDEMILKRQVNNLQETTSDNYDTNIVPFIRKDKSKNSLEKRCEAIETKLIELGMQANSKEKVSAFLEFTSNYEPKGASNAVILKEMVEILTNDTDCFDVAKKVFSKFYNDSEIQKQLTELVFVSGEYEKGKA